MKKLLTCSLILILGLIAFTVASPPAQAQSVVKISSPCPLTASNSGNSFTANTQLIAAPGNAKQRVIVCGVFWMVNQTTGAADFGLVTSTTSGNACATSPVNLTPQWKGTASVLQTRDISLPANSAIRTPLNTAVCAKLSATPTGAQIIVQYGIENIS